MTMFACFGMRPMTPSRRSPFRFPLLLLALALAFATGALAADPDADVNNDSAVDVVDVQATVNAILSSSGDATYDVNLDGGVDVVDIQLIVNIILAIPTPLSMATKPVEVQVSTPFSSQVVAFGGTPPYTFAASGALPAGTSLSTAGVLSGTVSSQGTYPFSVSLNDAVGPAKVFQTSLVVGASSSNSPAFISSPVTSVMVNQLYSYSIVVSGTPTPTLSIFNRPSWLTLSGTTLSGTPTESHLGTTGTITLSASNGNLPNAIQQFTIAVNSGGPVPVITSTAPTTATQGTQYVYNIVATGTPPAVVTAQNLPSWLTLNNRTLSGIPQAAHVGTHGPITITADNGNPTVATQVFSVTVSGPNAAPAFTSAAPATTATAFVSYSHTFVFTGSPAPTFTVANLPRWLTLSGNTISGTPGTGDVEQTGLITATASNGIGNPAIQNWRITVSGQPYPGLQPEVIYEFPATSSNGNGLVSMQSRVVLVFSEEINPANVLVGLNNAVFVGKGPLDGAYSNLGTASVTFASGLAGLTNRVLVVNPGASLGTDTNMIVNMWPQRISSGTAGQGFFNMNGNPLISQYPDRRFGSFNGDPSIGVVWQNSQNFDTAPPTRLSAAPAAGSTNAATNAIISVTFNEIIDPSSVAANFSVSDAGGTVTGSVTVDPTTMSTVHFTPSRNLLTTVNVTIAGIRDLSGNSTLAAQNYSFTVGTDNVAPLITNLTVNGIPDHLNGSAANGGGSPGGGRLKVPQNGFTIDMEYSDAGGTGVSRTIADFTISANVVVQSLSAGSNLSGLFPATHVHVGDSSASFLVPSTVTFPTGAVTLTARVKDTAGNQSLALTFTVDVASATTSILPLEGSPDVWNLYFNRDHETTVFNFAGRDVASTNNDSISPNSVADFTEDLTGHGFMGGTGASGLVNSGGGLQMQQAARNWIINRILYHTHRHYGLYVPYTDANPNPGFGSIMNAANPSTVVDSVNVRFVNSDAEPSTSVPRMAFGGIPGTMVLGRASFNPNNTLRNEDNGTTTATTNLGLFTLNDIFTNWNGTAPASASYMFIYFDEVSPFNGATVAKPVGSDSNDPFVFDPMQNPATFTGDRANRHRKVLRAMDAFALQWAQVCAHEIGHSLGLIKDGIPGPGLYGGNAAFSGSTSGHISLAAYQTGSAINVMNPSVSFEGSQSRFSAFNQLALAYLLGTELAD